MERKNQIITIIALIILSANVGFSNFLFVIAPTVIEYKTKELQMRAKAKAEAIKRGQPLEIEVIVRNSSRRDVYLVVSNPLSDYSMEVRDDHGHLVSPSREGQRLLQEALWQPRRTSVLLGPGEEKKEILELNRIYDLPVGSYSLIIRRYVILETHSSVQLVSNQVAVRVMS